MAFNTDPYEYSNKPHNFFKSNFYGKQGLGASNPDYTYTQNNFNDYETKKAQPKPEPMATKKGLKEKAGNFIKGRKLPLQVAGAIGGASMLGSGDTSDALMDAATGYLATEALGYMGGKGKKLVQGVKKNGFKKGLKETFSDPETALTAASFIPGWGKLIAAAAATDYAQSRLRNAPSLIKGVWDIPAGALQRTYGELSQLWDDGQNLKEGNQVIQRGVDAIKDVFNGDSNSKKIHNTNKILAAQQKGIISNEQAQKGELPSNLQNIRVYPEDIYAMPQGENKPTVAEQQTAQSPAESWPQERARLAKEMQDSIKANPNDPSKWKVPQGWGAVRGSDGEMRYHIPDERFDPVKAQREEDVARAKVYYNSALSNASSPLSTAAYRASQQDLMDQLVRDFPEIAQNQGVGGLIIGNGRAGLRGGSNAIDPTVKLALEQQEQMRKLEAENIEKMVEDAKRMDPDNPVGQAEDIARALLAPQTFGRVNPYEPVMQAWQRANALNHNVINKTLRDNGIYDFESTNVRKDLPMLKNLTNSITNNLFGTEFFDDEYMVGDNVIDASKLAPVSKRSMDNTDAYNTYLRQAEAQGIRPMDYTTWLLTGGYRG